MKSQSRASNSRKSSHLEATAGEEGEGAGIYVESEGCHTQPVTGDNRRGDQVNLSETGTANGWAIAVDMDAELK